MLLSQLKTFQAVVEAGNFTKAALELNLTQPAVTHHIKSLEDEFDIVLLDRSVKPVVPTEAGKLLYEKANEIVGIIYETKQRLTDMEDGTAGTVRIAAGSTACIHTLPSVIDEFRKQNPKIDIVISSGTTKDIIGLLKENHADIGIVTSPVDIGTFDETLLFEDETLLAAPANGAKYDIGSSPLIAFKRGYGYRSFIDDFLWSIGISPDVKVELDNIEAIKELVKIGLGIAFIPGSSLTENSDSVGVGSIVDGLKILKLPGNRRLTRSVRVIHLSGRYMSLACRRFIDYISNWFKAG